MPKIVADRIGRTYKTGTGVEVRALDGVSLTAGDSGMTAIVGQSGSGKTTLLQCLSGLDVPDEGSISLLGTDLQQSSEAEISCLYREQIGFVFQQYNLVESLNALDNVLLPQRLSKSSIDRRAAIRWFGRLGLAGKESHLPAQLSGGEQQRVALIRALIKKPAIVFADEPTGALDSENGRVVLDILQEQARNGVSVLMVTHDVAAASRANRVVVLRDGHLVEDLAHPKPDDILAALQSTKNGVS
ncbi:ABC transporter ATP-binding protein [Plantibacter sp. YIM 135347]|uniref:ABC transporter ATP-binding protein n=1 Tax=Plantibacter sp. YIM 135347 TaxID=3423919 RepID=UPI003D33B9FB